MLQPTTAELVPRLVPMHRIAPQDALEHPRRRIVMDAIQARPGLGFRDLVRLTSIASGTLRHHLTVLRRSRLIWGTQHDAKVLHFPIQVPHEAHALPEVLAKHVLDDFDSRILQHLRGAAAPVFQKALLDAHPPAVPRSTIQHRIKRLVRWGLITENRQGRWKRYA